MLHFVGAGSGAVDLITVRGQKLLTEADIIIYAGSLVNPELLSYAKEGAELHNSAYLTLDQVLEIIKRGNAENKEIVRLHTGDPSIYGAIREQMDRLDQLGITYDSCPGVSACFGAAASLNLEYTLPGISQSLIITRMAGRTEVPEKESIESFASHQASMAIYLSSGRISELTDRLIAGGYREDTPAALIYKASWPEERKWVCRLKELPEVAKKNQITKTALVLVGEVIAPKIYEESRLYAADFSTEYRRASEEELSVICFTEQGEKLGRKVKDSCPDFRISLYRKYGDSDRNVQEPLSDWVKSRFQKKQGILFIGAAGIAVRAIAESVKDKQTDSPVLVMDELGQNIIPILSGHLGGANELAEKIGALVGAVPVITTATDLEKKFSVDLFSKRHGLHILNKAGIARISSKVLAGEKLRILVEEPFYKEIEEALSEEAGLSYSIEKLPDSGEETADILISEKNYSRVKADLELCPKNYVLGFGCKKGKSLKEMEDFVFSVLEREGLSLKQISALASIDRKKDENCILEFSVKWQIPCIFFTAEELSKTEGEFLHSDFVESTVGVDNVCERAALSASRGGELRVRKTAENGMTLSISRAMGLGQI